MLVITGRNVNTIFPVAMLHMQESGVLRESRNGPTLELPVPLSIRHFRPLEHVLFDEDRRISPWLHFFEPLWLLAGRKDVKFLTDITPRFINYSDDGVSFFSSYGERLRFPQDQLRRCIDMIKKDENDRRVLGMIRRPEDLWVESRDQSCNCMFTCRVRGGRLDLHVFNRSNDMIWGALGTNVCQFSVIQEYIAAGAGLPVGELYQITTCPHVYVNEQWRQLKNTSLLNVDPYTEGQCEPYPMFSEGIESFDYDLSWFFNVYDKGGDPGAAKYQTQYFNAVVVPFWNALKFWKARQYDYAKIQAERIAATDWRLYLNQYMNEVK